MFVVQPTEQVGQVGRRACSDHPHRYRAPHQSVQGVDDISGALNGRKHSVGMWEDSSPGLGQTNGSTTPIEQFLTQLTFQPLTCALTPGCAT
ncbi:hypothetical protein GCM10020255_061370 [Rhodococcus baikonurensis]